MAQMMTMETADPKSPIVHDRTVLYNHINYVQVTRKPIFEVQTPEGTTIEWTPNQLEALRVFNEEYIRDMNIFEVNINTGIKKLVAQKRLGKRVL